MGERAALGVIGAGGFGTALGALVARAGNDVVIWSMTAEVTDEINREHTSRERLPDVRLPDRLRATSDPGELAARARLLLIAVSSTEARERARALGEVIDGRHMVVHAIGALAGPDEARLSQVIEEETPARRIGALAGPALPADLATGRFAAMVCASPFDEVTREARRVLNLPPAIRLYTSRDLTGVELAATLSGAYSIAFGMGDVLGIGPGPRAVLITRVVAEAQRLVVALGGEARTFTGLAGLGNLLVRTSPGSGDHAPGYQFGRALAQEDTAAADAPATPVAERRLPEAARAAATAVRLARRHRQRAPVLEAIARVIDGRLRPSEAAAALSDTVALEE
ncbi:MAG TPA: 2-dehydropantoate 2-reductase N-terminal domain-containing protein [Kofleriaceae bacterium]|nr:2-dehydropantoate 2-reductase N-terminal domain-containing protein [Kofleriaceae bacterium]